jgi:hypothetical protein
VRYALPFAIGLLLGACTSPNREVPPSQQTILDTLSRHQDGTPKRVDVQRGDSIIERRTYRHTGTLRKVIRGDSVQTYFDLHDPDSASILQDYLQGRWRNLSADPSRDQSSLYYIFDADRLTFENPARSPLESLRVTYKDNQTLVTNEGMSVRPQITSFDTVRVTGYTLVRLPSDSL